MESINLKLPQFEGPIELLWTLIQKEELDICDLEIHRITAQIKELFSEDLSLNREAESIYHAGHLLLMKSRALLPSEEQEVLPEEFGEGLHPTLIERLIECCRFRDAALNLALREEKARESFPRLPVTGGVKKPLGIDHLSLSDLASIFQVVLEKATLKPGTIEEEEWRISDKIGWIQNTLKAHEKIGFDLLFPEEYSKLEVIVIFLAILELMKRSEIRVAREIESNNIVIFAHVE